MNKPTAYNFREENWYISLRDDLSASHTERRFAAEMMVLEWYEEAGKRLLHEIGERAGYGERIIPTLAEDTNISTSTLYNALTIVRAMGDMSLQDFVESLKIEGKTPSVRKVLESVNPSKKEKKEPEFGACPTCFQPLKAPLTTKQIARINGTE